MKNTILALTILLLFNCCNKKDDDAPTNPIDQLPPATQTGANTAGCLVDGEAFLPNNKSLRPLSLNYLDGKDFSLKISNKIDNIIYSILISRYNTALVVGNTYPLNTKFEANASSGEYSINTEVYPSPNYYSTSPSVTGELTITHHDFNNAVLSGTFWFDAINANGKVIEIREGRFDVEY